MLSSLLGFNVWKIYRKYFCNYDNDYVTRDDEDVGVEHADGEKECETWLVITEHHLDMIDNNFDIDKIDSASV